MSDSMIPDWRLNWQTSERIADLFPTDAPTEEKDNDSAAV